MLAKLLKYDIKAAGFLIPAIYAVIAIFFILGKSADALNIGQLVAGFAFLSAVAGISAGVLAIVTSVTRYHKSMFCEEGYLLQTLPVSKSSLLFSKVLTTYIWLILGGGALFIGIASCISLTGGPSLKKLFDILFSYMPKELIIFIVVSAFVQLFLFIAEVYFSMTLANIGALSKHNVLFSVIIYFICNTVTGFIEVGAMLFIPLGLKFTEGKASFVFDTTLSSLITRTDMAALNNVTIGIGSVITDILAAVVFLVLTVVLLKKKISLK